MTFRKTEIAERGGDERIHRGLVYKRTRMKRGRGKAERRKIPVAGQAVIHAMVHGPYEDIVIAQDGPAPPRTIKAFEPMTFMDACRALGLDPRRILDLTRLSQFNVEMTRQLNARRGMEQARNLGVAIAIRDSEGDGSPLAASTRLKAIMVIDRAYALANPPQPQPQPNVQINNIQQTQLANAAKPGYVIRVEAQKTIEHDAKEPHPGPTRSTPGRCSGGLDAGLPPNGDRP
jgi:hypothetical protein